MSHAHDQGGDAEWNGEGAEPIDVVTVAWASPSGGSTQIIGESELP